MNPIETLTRLDLLRRELHCQRERIACLEEAARYLSPSTAPIGGTGGKGGPLDRVGKLAGQIVDAEAELDKLEEEYARGVGEASIVLSVLNDPLEREVLTKRFVAGLRWEDVAKQMGYSYRAVQRLKKAAFIKLSYNVL